jgi:hypothetical protein
MLHPKDQRETAFMEAQVLYNLRSTIAHGSSPKDKMLKIGGEKVTLDEAGRRATNALRRVIFSFLPQGDSSDYKNAKFWKRAYFGLDEEVCKSSDQSMVSANDVVDAKDD